MARGADESLPRKAAVSSSAEAQRIYLTKDLSIYALISPEDYAWAIQWCWQITWDRHKRKAYATRSTHEDGQRVKLYLHKEILKRTMKLPPSRKHTMGDHGDGQSLNCQRWNLEWATPASNRQTARKTAPPILPIVDELPF